MTPYLLSQLDEDIEDEGSVPLCYTMYNVHCIFPLVNMIKIDYLDNSKLLFWDHMVVNWLLHLLHYKHTLPNDLCKFPPNASQISCSPI